MIRIPKILTVLSLLTAMSLISCKKETIHYTLSIENIPTSFGDGEAVTITIPLTTNAPDSEIQFVNVPSWINASISASVATLELEENRTCEARSAQVIISLRDNTKAVRIPVNQDWLLVNRPGMVQFKDKAFKKHMLGICDADGDNDVSYEEAETVREIEAVSKGIKDLAGLEAFKNVCKLDLRNNDVENLWLDDPAIYSKVKYINVEGNQRLAKINVAGCYAGVNFEIILPRHLDSWWDVDFTNIAPYKSMDFSYNGLKKLETHSVGRGIALNFFLNEYLDVDCALGVPEELVNYQLDELFSVEPFKSMRPYFDVNLFVLVSPSPGIRATFDDWPELYSEWRKVASVDISISDEGNLQFSKDSFFINILYNTDGDKEGRPCAILFNFPSSLNTCVYLTGKRGPSLWSHTSDYDYILTHEMGHAIGGLCDEYGTDNVFNAPNFTYNKEHLPWERFLSIPKYASRIDLVYKNGGYYPSHGSLMGGNTINGTLDGIFNTPSRFAIYSNIILCSQWDLSQEFQEPDTFEDFLEYDIINDDLPI